MKNLLTSIIFVFVGVLVILSCKHEPPLPPLNGGTGGTGGGPGDTLNPNPYPCDPDTIYFSQTILPLLVSNCAIPGCHSADAAEDGVILNNYENIINTGDVRPFDLDGSDLYEVITENDPDNIMPPPGDGNPLTSEQIGLIAAWIQQGALNLSCNNGDCDTTNVTYVSKIEPIITAKCLGCHSGSSPQGDISLSGYANVRDQSIDGSLLQAVQHVGTATPMPYQSSQLPQCEIDLIRIWIENGAPQ
ncbi:hypothetical protein G3O08_05690 [Cryomorpha ignava]|uniref:Cytochrome C Planctomycete-type domain-containing protein n=1 Tax=Cryomorpha ignava TaxID=101383 RepID=A0A7K3WPM6_9FLAO|nr:c-type cytochrome domain-containing protein [Cryomorpha ignava]NEN22991.1 hypothetical protein [Cryomorpha ignava]